MSETERDDDTKGTGRFPTSTVTLAILLAVIPLALAIGLSFWLLGGDDEAEMAVATAEVEQTTPELALADEAPLEAPASDETATDTKAKSSSTADSDSAPDTNEKGVGSLVEDMLSALDNYMAGTDDQATEIATQAEMATQAETAAQASPSNLDTPEIANSDTDQPQSDLLASVDGETKLEGIPTTQDTAEASGGLQRPPVADTTEPPLDEDTLSNDATTGAPAAEALPAPAQQQAKAWDPISIRMSSSGGDLGSYRLGDTLEITVSLNKDAYLYCFYKDSQGQVFRVFPNDSAPEARRLADEIIVIPGADTDFEIVLDRLGNTEEFGCVAAEVDLLYTLPENLRAGLEPLPVADLSEIVQAFSAADTLDIAESRLGISVTQ